ncbi:MAG: MBL fold metallo-hydrolase [Planctomycetota bacterium]|jgi:7,8-dihydropterin-6-yl-methyl-4-(beta-D-ribofuranosyl)aminobenzene 5'-phosphate synthase
MARDATTRLLVLITLGLAATAAGCSGPEETDATCLQITVVFNNEPLRSSLKTEWGFACHIEGLEKEILFDTGGNGELLLSNMRKLGLDPASVDLVMLSHIHGDHVGGLEKLAAVNPDLTICMPKSFPEAFRSMYQEAGFEIIEADQALRLAGNAHSTGELGMAIIEQSLILDTPQGLVIVTGCAHPGIVETLEKTEQILKRKIHLVMGGFHLGRASEQEIQTIIARFKDWGVEKVAPTHCTGDTAVRLFKEAWGDDYVDAGCGAKISI